MTQAPDKEATNILSMNSVEVLYDNVMLAIKGVSIQVPKGGMVALLGSNGAGKSTTLKAFIHQFPRYARSWTNEWVKKMRQRRT